jgi:poly-gamma-glutamate system protein
MRTGTAGVRRIYTLGLLAVVFYAADRLAFPTGSAPAGPAASTASRLMAESIAVLGPCAAGRSVNVDPSTDLNRTGLIGVEDSPITTSLGQLEAKRTALNPNFAGCVARMLEEAGVRRGEAVAIGASSSFPGMILAALSAVKAVGAEPVMISSLGASNWGANNPAFTQLEILDCLRAAGTMSVKPVAVAVGGERDDGSDMSEDGRALLRAKLRDSGLPVIEERDLAANVRARMAFYKAGAAGRRIAAFINVGGSWANMGVDAGILEVLPGLSEVRKIPPPEKRGVIQEMASRGVPVIHLLFIKGLAERCGLPWDPVPLPRPNQGTDAGRQRGTRTAEIVLLLFYIVLSAAILVFNDTKIRISKT